MAEFFERGNQPRVALERGGVNVRAAIDRVIPFDLHGEVLVGCESGIEVLDATQKKLFHVNDRREDHRGRDLCHDHHGPYAAELQAAAAGRGLLEPRAHAARNFQRRHDAGDGGARHRQHDRDRERARGQAEIEPERKAAQVGLEKRRAPGAKRKAGSGDADDRRDTAEDQRLSEHLHHDTPAARAERRPNHQIGFT